MIYVIVFIGLSVAMGTVLIRYGLGGGKKRIKLFSVHFALNHMNGAGLNAARPILLSERG